MIDVKETLTGNDGFVQTDNILYRLYPLLDGFTVETAGLYGYLKSWRNNTVGNDYYHCVWLSRAEMYAQSGLKRHSFDKHLDVLIRYSLVSIRKSAKRANKDIFEIHDPITEAEFRSTYADKIAELEKRLAEIYAANGKDKAEFPAKKAAWKVEQVELSKKTETPADDSKQLADWL